MHYAWKIVDIFNLQVLKGSTWKQTLRCMNRDSKVHESGLQANNSGSEQIFLHKRYTTG